MGGVGEGGSTKYCIEIFLIFYLGLSPKCATRRGRCQAICDNFGAS